MRCSLRLFSHRNSTNTSRKNKHIDTRVTHVTEMALAAQSQLHDQAITSVREELGNQFNGKVAELVTFFSNMSSPSSNKSPSASLSKFSGKPAELYAWTFACTQFLHNHDPKMSAYKAVSTAAWCSSRLVSPAGHPGGPRGQQE